jgi:NAD(P)-dependent dehydrogenase (short-subunit alcohol dehydrogenase family)
MSNPVVLITGALTGIGRAAAFAFAREGNRVVVSGRHEDVGQALAAELREFGGKAEFIRADVRREDDVRSLVDQTVVRFGRLDAAVNNADGGQTRSNDGADGRELRRHLRYYVLGTLLSMKHELRVMHAQHSGSIINISSTYGHLGARGASVYAASKHAVEGMTRSAALEAAVFSVRVNAVAPGPTETAMLNRFTGTPERKAALVSSVPLGHVGAPDDIAGAIVFLASNKASFVTGHILAADGGKTAA